MTARKANKTLKRIRILIIIAIITVLLGVFAFNNKDIIFSLLSGLVGKSPQIENKIPDSDEKPEVIPPVGDEDNTDTKPTDDYSIYRAPIWNITDTVITSEITLPDGSAVHASVMMRGITYVVLSSRYSFATNTLSETPYISIITFSAELKAQTYFTIPSSQEKEFTGIFPNNFGFNLLLSDSNNTYFYSLTESLTMNLEYKTPPLSSIVPYISFDGTTLFCLSRNSTEISDLLLKLSLSNGGICLKSEEYAVPSSIKIASAMTLGSKTYITLNGATLDTIFMIDAANQKTHSVSVEKLYNLFPYQDGKTMRLCAFAASDGGKIITYDDNLTLIESQELGQNFTGIFSRSNGANTFFYDSKTSQFTVYSGTNSAPLFSLFVGIRPEKMFQINGKPSFIAANGKGFYSVDTLAKSLKFTELPYEITNAVAVTNKEGLYSTDIKISLNANSAVKIFLRFSR